MTFVSRIPQIVAKVEQGVEKANEESAKRIAAAAKNTVPVDSGDLKRSIEPKAADGDDWVVAVGEWYGHLVEWGSARKGARPFLTPAAEAERDAHRKAIRDLYS